VLACCLRILPAGRILFRVRTGSLSGRRICPIGKPTATGESMSAVEATVIAANPSNPNDVWLGTATGGVWHSTNGGVNWLPMSDNEASLSIGAVALDGCSANGCATLSSHKIYQHPPSGVAATCDPPRQEKLASKAHRKRTGPLRSSIWFHEDF